MFAPDDPLNPPNPVFDEPWQAQMLAMADTLIQSGQLSAQDWASALGSHLKAAEAVGNRDTAETYYLAALGALENRCAGLGLDAADLTRRQTQWRQAYQNTPHGQPVTLDPAKR